MDRSLPAAVIAILISVAVAQTSQAAESHVKASLIADVTAIEPAKPFTIGVLLQIDPGWHIYWTNPGDSGLATSVKFKLPAGFTITPDPFPVPRKMQQAANEVIYGYEDAVLLTAHVTPPADLPANSDGSISATANWLVCKQACMPGKATVDLTLKVADHAERANVATFYRLGSKVVPAGQKSPDIIRVGAELDPASHIVTVHIHWNTPIREIELFPGADDAVVVGDISVGETPKSTTPITLKLKILAGQQPAADRLPVLISYRDVEGTTRGFETSIPLK